MSNAFKVANGNDNGISGYIDANDHATGSPSSLAISASVA